MGMTEKIRLMMVKRQNISESELARRLGELPQSFNPKMKRDNFTERDMRRIADALGCTLKITFVMNDTGEEF
ncbi:transcriptional regulator [Spirochaetia bacterium]|nr:transcriptional regulator [Spirochaetia bacterium]GHV78145.1 transcriptional regulator [Spirochaetia bacterium]